MPAIDPWREFVPTADEVWDLAKVAHLHRRAGFSATRSEMLVLVFSEFGRRLAENASGGTDHGTAAPMFFWRAARRVAHSSDRAPT